MKAGAWSFFSGDVLIQNRLRYLDEPSDNLEKTSQNAAVCTDDYIIAMGMHITNTQVATNLVGLDHTIGDVVGGDGLGPHGEYPGIFALP